VVTAMDANSTQFAAIRAKTDTIPVNPAAIGSAMALTSGERNSTADAVLARSLGTEAYPAVGAVPTVAQALFQLMAFLGAGKVSISGTTMTVMKLNGSTTAMTLTLDSATTPTSKTRAT